MKTIEWDKEVTVTLTLKQVYILQKCAESIDWMGEMCDFTIGRYEDVEPWHMAQIKEAQNVLIEKIIEERNAHS